jgi:hypothetical protein
LLGGGLRLPRLGLGPLAAPPEREPLLTRIPWVSRPATVSGHHLAPPQPCQRQIRLLGHRVQQPAEPPLRRPRLPRPRRIHTARTGALEDFLTGLNHRQAPFRYQDSVIGPPSTPSAGATPEAHPGDLRPRRSGSLIASSFSVERR